MGKELEGRNLSLTTQSGALPLISLELRQDLSIYVSFHPFKVRWKWILALLIHSFYSFLIPLTNVYQMLAMYNIWHYGDYKADP